MLRRLRATAPGGEKRNESYPYSMYPLVSEENLKPYRNTHPGSVLCAVADLFVAVSFLPWLQSVRTVSTYDD